MLRLKKYVITLIVCYIILFLVNMTLSLTGVCNFSVWYSVWYSLLIVLAFFLLDLLAAIIVRVIPRKWINIHSKMWKTFKFEKKLYESLGVRRFKDKIPELGGALAGFSKTNVASDDPIYLEMFLKEMIKGEITHWLGLFFGIVIFFIFPNNIWNFAFPMFWVNSYFNILPIIVQRYNRPKLYKLYIRKTQNQKVEEKTLWVKM